MKRLRSLELVLVTWVVNNSVTRAGCPPPMWMSRASVMFSMPAFASHCWHAGAFHALKSDALVSLLWQLLLLLLLLL
jgi:hypothetical protein